MQNAIILFRERDFLFYVASRFLATTGTSMQHTVLAWQVYVVTGSALQLAFVGLARFIPSLLINFVAGAVADSFDRRLVLGGSQVINGLSSLVFLYMTITGTFDMTVVYILSALLGLVGTFENPARQSLIPQIVPPDLLQRAFAFAATLQQLSAVIGPVIAGFLIAALGIAPGYIVHMVLIGISTLVLPLVRARFAAGSRRPFNVAMMKEGVLFLKDHHAPLGAMTIDMVAVIFAGATALLPVYSLNILDVGSEGFGMLTASIAVGSFTTAFFLTFLPPIKEAGKAMVYSIVGFSIMTVAFGLSTNFIASLILYGLVGAFDQVSVVMRSIIIQMGTPDALRGRVSSVYFVFVGASNQLSGVRAGIVADRTNAVFSVVSGGIMCLIASLVLIKIIPELWNYQADQAAEEAKA